MKGIWFDPRAEEEFLHGAQYYEEHEVGLGSRFMFAVKAALLSVRTCPRIYSETYLGCRKCRVARFPYALIFRESKGEVQIIAVMHLKRRPNYLRGRI